MKKTSTLALVAVVAAGVLVPQPVADAQLRLVPVVRQQGEVALGLALRKLASTGTLMMTTAHPDDENNGLLAEVGHGLGWRTVLVSATRGDGGQNEIGPELFDALAVLRTEELGAAHAFDGAEQYFTRAVDFGYSFSIDETLQKWGKEEILSDFVRLIRTIRPDVVVGFLWDGTGGGQHHQASSRLTAEAFRAAADPSRFPEQIAEGLRPWQAKKFYYTAGFFGRTEPAAPGLKVLSIDSATFDPLLGRTYAEIGAEARSMHKCQGMSQLLPLPGASRALRYVLHDTVLPGQRDVGERSVTDGIDAALPSLARFAGERPPSGLTATLERMAAAVDAARRALAAGGPAAAARPLAEGLAATRGLRAELGSLGLSDEARYEIDVRLARKEREFEQALVLAHGLRIEATADDGLVIPGQVVKVGVTAAAMTGEPVSVSGVRVSGLEAAAPACEPGTTGRGRPWRCEIAGRIPADAPPTTPYFRRLPDAARYAFDRDVPFGLPFRPTPYRVTVDLELDGIDVAYQTDVQYRYEDLFAGEKRMELTVVPAMAVRLTPEIVIVPAGDLPLRPTAAGGTASRAETGRRGRSRELRATVINQTKGPASAEVSLEVPSGWTVTPAAAPVSFAREDEEATVRFEVVPAAGATGAHTVRTRVRAGAASYDRGYEVIEYPHISRRHVVKPAEATVKVLNVRLAPDLDVGYVMGVGDMVPAAIEQLGARLHQLTSDDLAWGDLDRYDVIVTGVRAYERRADLRANNHRLLAYAERGGTVLVQYNKFEFNEAQYGPWPAKVSSNRVTDENAPVRVLVPDHPAFTTPNAVTAETWKGWVQERGLYFLGERDPRYIDLVETEDSFPYNAGPKRGALVEARTGKGRWIYIGLNLWRQLPAGTEGAYTLLANLLSLGKPAEARAARR